ncbi:uncharacterized protein LOC142175304 [Nicotiana tabacum]|uniref:Uncharacterized protein LOC142175304 n=1 Tax=Nicotiana tabacum TaxID=4097 RepID=A0AC58TLA9_TOBAC
MAEELKKLTGRVQSVEGGKGDESLNYEDLCIQPDVEQLEGYKPPKFEMFNGTGDPKVHLRTYCNKLAGVGKNEQIRMKLFIRSLIGDALSWYISQNPKKWVNWWVNPKKTCAYHSSMNGHTIEECRMLKDKIQTLIDTKVIPAKEATLNVRNNPLPDHRGKGVNMIETDEEWNHEGSIRHIREGDTPKTSHVILSSIVVQTQAPFEVEVVMPFTVMIAPTPYYKSDIVPWVYVAEGKRKGKAKMEEIGTAQGMTRTDRVYTPDNLGGTSKETASKPPVVETCTDNLWRKVQVMEYPVVDHLNKTPAQISILSLLQNSDAHENALMNVLSEAYVPAGVTSGEMANMFGVLIDGGSSLNIWPLTILKRLGKVLHEIQMGSMNVKAFDGSQRATIGEINLDIQMGPTWFDDEFHVLDISTTYNLLLGRPWIYAVGAVASTLHQSNLEETEAVNSGDSETVKETRISIHLSPSEKEEYVRFLREYEDIFAWSYDDMTGLSTSIVAHKLPTNPMCQPVKQKLSKFKPYMSLKIKEEVIKKIKDKLNHAKCAFEVPAGKMLGFIVSRRGMELDPSKIKAVQDLPLPKNKKGVMSFLGHLNYISRFIAQSTVICEPIFKMLRKDAAKNWTEECEKAFSKIKEYLSQLPVLVPPEPGRPLLLYFSMLDGAFGCVVKGQALADHLAENPVDGEYKPLKTYFPDEEVSLVGKDFAETYDCWRMFFDGAANFKGVAIGVILVSENGQHYLGIDVIGLIKPADSNGHKFILVAIDYFTKLVEVASNKAVTKKVVADFVRDRIVCRFGVPDSIITDNAANLNNDLKKALCETFKIKHQNFTTYRQQMNGVLEAANKNIKKILRKMGDNYKQWHEKLPFSLLGYHTTVRTSTGATPYLLVYGTEVVISAEVDIPSLRIIQEAELSDAE